MCTVSWCRPNPGSYALFFNRDESKQRLPALAPQRFQCGETPYLSPIDGNHGGTWLLANARGLSIGLLNHYAASVNYSPESPTSRGALVSSLADTESCSAFDQRIAAVATERYRPFLIFAVSPSASSLWIWDGEQLVQKDAVLPLTTSSFNSAAVVTGRKKLFSEITEPTPVQLTAFHESHDPARSEYSVRMRRERSQTVSYSRIDVSPETVDYSYRPEPDETLTFAEIQTISIPRCGL